MNQQKETSSLSMQGFSGHLSRGKRYGQTLAMLLAAGCVLSAILFLAGNMTIAKWGQTLIFLVLGFMNVKMLMDEGSLSANKKLSIVFLAAAIIFVILYGVYFFLAPSPLMNAAAAGGAFILPYIIKEVWLLFGSLSSGKPVIFYYSDELPLQKATTFLNSMPIQFKVEANGSHKKLSFRAPIRMKLAVVFYHLVQDQNKNNGQLLPLNEEETSSGWIFYTTGFGGLIKYLDPEAGLVENGVKQNKMIVAKQVTAPRPLKQLTTEQ